MSNINHNAIIRLTQQGQEKAMGETDGLLSRFNNQPMSIRQYYGRYGVNEGVIDLAIRRHIADGDVYYPGGGGGSNFLGMLQRHNRPIQVMESGENEQ